MYVLDGILIEAINYWKENGLVASSVEADRVPGGGGGGALIFPYIRRLGPIFWVQNFEYFLGFSEK